MKQHTISPVLYKKIIAVMPIPCVDVIVVQGKKFLLGKRVNKPAQGLWWLVGGGVIKGETIERAAIRKVKEETGLRVRLQKILGVDDTMFTDSAFGSPTHTVNTVFCAVAPAGHTIHHDSQNVALQWFSKINPHWPAYVKAFLHK